MKEKRKKSNVEIRKNTIGAIILLSIFVIGTIIAVVLAMYVQIDITIIFIIIFCVVFFVLLLKTAVYDSIKSQQGDMAKVMQKLSESKYTPIKYTGPNADLISLYAEALEPFHYTLAARLSKGEILYSIVNEDGNETGRTDHKKNATFFINNFRVSNTDS